MVVAGSRDGPSTVANGSVGADDMGSFPSITLAMVNALPRRFRYAAVTSAITVLSQVLPRTGDAQVTVADYDRATGLRERFEAPNWNAEARTARRVGSHPGNTGGSAFAGPDWATLWAGWNATTPQSP